MEWVVVLVIATIAGTVGAVSLDYCKFPSNL